MATPADVLVVEHHDERTTRYERVTYWPHRESITVWDAEGNETRHEDVQRYFADCRAT